MSCMLWDPTAIEVRRYSSHDHFWRMQIMDGHLANVIGHPSLGGMSTWTYIRAFPGISYVILPHL